MLTVGSEPRRNRRRDHVGVPVIPTEDAGVAKVVQIVLGRASVEDEKLVVRSIAQIPEVAPVASASYAAS